MSVEIFCCYARKDQMFLNELKTYLFPLEREGRITLWADTNINAGTEWEKEIEKHLDTAEIILLLVSSNFIVSEYCYSIEMQKALERHNRGVARVIPIILGPIHWQNAPFGKLQALPKDAKPITNWRNKKNAFFDIAEGIRKAVDDTFTQPPTDGKDEVLPPVVSHTEYAPTLLVETDLDIEPVPKPVVEEPSEIGEDEKYLTLADELAEFKHNFRSSDLDNCFDVLVSDEDLLLEVIGKDRYNELHANVAYILLHEAQAGLAKNNGDLTAETSNRDIANAVLMTLKKRVDGIRLRQSRRK